MKKLLGSFPIGGMNVSLYVQSGWGGEFTFIPDRGVIPEICIGLSSERWERVVSSLLHESFEFEMAHSSARYYRSYDYGNDLSSYVFMLDHSQFSDLCGRVAIFISKVLPLIANEYKSFKRKKNKPSIGIKKKKESK